MELNFQLFAFVDKRCLLRCMYAFQQWSAIVNVRFKSVSFKLLRTQHFSESSVARFVQWIRHILDSQNGSLPF